MGGNGSNGGNNTIPNNTIPAQNITLGNSSNTYSLIQYWLSEEMKAGANNLTKATKFNKTQYTYYTNWITAQGPNNTYGKDYFLFVNSTTYNVNATFKFAN